MKKRLGKLVICGALSMLLGGPLLAQSHGNGHGNGNGHDNGNGYGHDNGNHGRDDRGRGHQDRRYQGMHDRGRHEGWYKKGGHMPSEYRGPRYVVTDWRHDHLREPPHGYHWVRSDNGDFLLVAIATGIIVDILAHQ